MGTAVTIGAALWSEQPARAGKHACRHSEGTGADGDAPVKRWGLWERYVIGGVI